MPLDQDRSRVLESLRNRQEEQRWSSRRRSLGCVTEIPHHASLAQRVGSGMEFGCRWRWQDGWLGVTV